MMMIIIIIKRVKLDVEKFSFGNKVYDEWNRLPEWVVNVDEVNKFKRNYLKDNRGFK